MKNKKYKLMCSLYCDEDYEQIDDYKFDDTCFLFAKKGQIAERFDLTDELRNEYCIPDRMFKYLFLFKDNKYIYTQDENSMWFEQI